MPPHTATLDGTLHVVPFDGGSLAMRLADCYETALDAAGGDPRDVLVLKRLPTGISECTTGLRDAVGLQARPNVQSLPRHASAVLTEANPDVTRLSYEERIEFLARVLDGVNWSDYYEDASRHDSFGRDVGQLLLDATWRGGFDIPDDPAECDEYDEYLRELADVNDSFHAKLAERDLVEQAETISRAIDALDRPAVREHVEREFDVVLVAEFEECTAIDRAYLEALTRDAELICVAEEQASIERVKKEPGPIERLADGLTIVDHTDSDSEAEPEPETETESEAEPEPETETESETGTDADADTDVSIPNPGQDFQGHRFGRFLATGSCEPAGSHEDSAATEDVTEATARTIRTVTLDQQVEEVANEIEYLRVEHGWAYDEFAVLLRTVGDPMPRVRRVLRRAGVPTASAGVNGLEQDLAVRELHALAQYHIDGRERAFDLLEARIPDLDPSLIDDCIVRNSVAKSLKRWIVTTDLKRRIAADAEDIDAREQFRNVDRLLSIAEFVDAQDVLASDWIQFTTMLERAITYDAPYAHTAEVTVPEGGVTVGDVGLVKNDSRKAIFLLNVVDGEYPGDETLSPLFPTAWIKQMEGYPAVTQPSESAVVDTYATVEETAGNEFERYHDERARRQLAIGARAAEERLYFCSYRQTDGGVGRLQHRSRYLHAIEDADGLALEAIGDGDTERDIYTLGRASREILAQPWAELEAVQAEASTGGEVALEDAEETLAAIQAVLQEGSEDVDGDAVDPRFERAVETQFDLARGAVRPTIEEEPPSDREDVADELEAETDD